jgi:hypothetical protein
LRRENVCVLYSLLVFSACFIQGYSLPQQQRFGARKFAHDNDLDGGFSENSIHKDLTPIEAKEEAGIVQTVIQLAVKFLPTRIDALSGSTGPSQTDRIEGEDPFSMKNILFLGLKLFLAIAGSGNSIDKSDSSPIPVSVMEAVLSTIVGAEDRSEVQVMAKQAVEVINLVISLVEALTTSINSTN